MIFAAEKSQEGCLMAKRKKDEDRLWTDEEWQAAVERSIALIKEAQEKAKTMTYDEFAKWWDEHGAVKGGGAYEALLEMREAMRGWDSKTKRKRRNKRQQNRFHRTILLERLSGATKRRGATKKAKAR
jgi:cellulase/cellobiase CelA1